MNQADNSEVEAALFELQQYLSDRIAPLMFADSLEILMYSPSGVVAREITAWTAGQYSGAGHRVPVSDYLFHAVRKLHRLGELELVSLRTLESFLRELTESLLAACPEEDRDLLRQNLAALGHAKAASAPVTILHRQPGATSAAEAAATRPAEPPLASRPAAPLVPPLASAGTAVPVVEVGAAEISQGLRRLNLLLERLSQAPPGAARTNGEAQQELVSQALSTAASSSKSGRELDRYLDELRRLGLPAQTDQMFQLLGDSLPGWILAAPAEGGERPPISGPGEAMYRLVALAPDTAESTRRYRELAHATIRQFNDGLLTRAAAMVEVLQRLADDRKVPGPAVEAVRQGSYGYLEEERLRKFAESPEKHFLLRTILNFFTPLSPEGLLHELRYEERHDRRRFLLSLLESQGAEARAVALRRLQEMTASGETPDPFFLRNLVYLLRLIPRAAGEGEADVEAVVRAARPGRLPSLMKEALTCLGKLKGERAEAALLSYLRSFEGMLLRPESASYSKEEVGQLLERTLSALARCGSKNAVRAVVEHGLREQPELGTTRARLAELSGLDLAGHPEAAARLLATVRTELPRGMRSFLVNKKRNEGLHHLVTALSGTTLPDVQALLGEVATRFPAEEFGRAAARAVGDMAQRSGPRGPAPVSLSGDLELFGLPMLLQGVAEIRATGTLTLFDQGGRVLSVIALEGGRVRSCQTGPLRDREAFFQLFEKPLPGRFAFVGSREGEEPPPDAHEVTPLILEGLRRYDEFRRARALVPDGVVLLAAAPGPVPLPDETEEPMVRALWERITSGATPLDCEADSTVDSFRVRRLLAHWLEQGALAQK
jgi:hypothetical protein